MLPGVLSREMSQALYSTGKDRELRYTLEYLLQPQAQVVYHIQDDVICIGCIQLIVIGRKMMHSGTC